MPPGTFHAVMTTRDSVSIGGMFYLPNQYTTTFYTLVQLHLHGQRICNSDIPTAPLYLFRILNAYHTILSCEGLLKAKAPLSNRDHDLHSELLKSAYLKLPCNLPSPPLREPHMFQ
jgi:hypothetical protein